MSKRILVTGGAGFIGSHLVDALVEEGHSVRVLDNLDAQAHAAGRVPPWLNSEAEFIRGTILDSDTVERALEGVQIVCHQAAAVGVGQSMYQIPYYVDTNVGGTGRLLNHVVNNRRSIEQVLVASSMSTYGEGQYECIRCGLVRPGLRGEAQLQARDWEPHCPHCGGGLTAVPTNEDAHQESTSVYSITKKAQEELVMTVCRAYEISAVAFRYFNAYGPRQSQSNPYTGVLALFMSRLRNGNRPTVYEDGMQTRDFIHVRDIARAYTLAICDPDAGSEIYNLGTGKPYTIAGIALDLAQALGVEIAPLVTHGRRKGDIRHCFADITRARAKLGWEPQVPFGEGLKELIAWSQSSPAEDRFEQAEQELRQHGLV